MRTAFIAVVMSCVCASAAPLEPKHLLPPTAGAVDMCCEAAQRTDAELKRMGVGAAGAPAVAHATYSPGSGFTKYARQDPQLIWAPNVITATAPSREEQVWLMVMHTNDCLDHAAAGETSIRVGKHRGAISWKTPDDKNVEARGTGIHFDSAVVTWRSSGWCFTIRARGDFVSQHLGVDGLTEIATSMAKWADPLLASGHAPEGEEAKIQRRAFDTAQERELKAER